MERELGAHAEAIASLKRDVVALRSQMSEVLAILHAAQGGWRTIVAIGTAGGLVGAVLTAIAGKLVHLVR